MGDQISIRMDPALKKQLARAAKIEGKTSSEVIRALVEDYLRQRDVGAYVDSLWERFGEDFKARKLIAKDVPAAIKASRKSRKENAGRS
ncbi:MAG: ribbon-helix-helix protein, CopG family [Betaproteobacteria bacterium]